MVKSAILRGLECRHSLAIKTYKDTRIIVFTDPKDDSCYLYIDDDNKHTRNFQPGLVYNIKCMILNGNRIAEVKDLDLDDLAPESEQIDNPNKIDAQDVLFGLADYPEKPKKKYYL